MKLKHTYNNQIEIEEVIGTNVLFTLKNKKSSEVSDFLVHNKIATRNDNFYAWRCLKALGIDTNDGVVRISLVHYNTHDDVKRIISVLKKIN